ncbi:glycerophosphodiester phosphodiesterase family protein [soil metagenome]
MSQSIAAQIYIPKFDVQGHRGARGLKPENSIPSFIAALDSGVTTIEMDVAITKDHQIVVSHEPWMNAAICQCAGKIITAKNEMKFNIFQMTYDEVKNWDCGLKGNEKFPEQEKMVMYKPLLRDVILAVENHIKNYTKYEVDYNIEIKSLPEGDGKFHPKPEEFSEMVYALLDQYLPMERVIIQSFDFRILKYWHKKYPEIRLAALVENLKTIDEHIKELGFVPSIYSPDYKLLDKDEVKHCHELKMRVVPWTVNDPAEMIALKGMNVDGFITDYPDRARKIKMTLAIKPKGGD